jgi:ABC-type antimicrobial peptide transport system permease subunit
MVVGVGSVAGIAIAVSAVQVVQQLLYGVSPSDPVTLAAVVAALMLTTLAAALPPAWRAARLNPAEGLKRD